MTETRTVRVEVTQDLIEKYAFPFDSALVSLVADDISVCVERTARLVLRRGGNEVFSYQLPPEVQEWRLNHEPWDHSTWGKPFSLDIDLPVQVLAEVGNEQRKECRASSSLLGRSLRGRIQER